jgi:hypothetical protein
MKTILSALTLCLLPTFAWSYLGETVQLRQTLQHVRSTTQQFYVLSEKADEDGVIRSTSWEGKFHPNLREHMKICGADFFKKLSQSSRARGPGAITVTSGGCTLSLGGHMGRVYGHAELAQ